MFFKNYLARENSGNHDRGPPELVHGFLFGCMDGVPSDPSTYYVPPVFTHPPPVKVEDVGIVIGRCQSSESNPESRDTTAPQNQIRKAGQHEYDE